MRMPTRGQEDVCLEDWQCGTKQGFPDDLEKRNGYEQRSRGNDKATKTTKAREPFALTGQEHPEEEKRYAGG